MKDNKIYKPYSLIDIIEVSIYFSIASLLLVLSVIFYTKAESYKDKPITTKYLTQSKNENSYITQKVNKKESHYNISFVKASRRYYPGSETNINISKEIYDKRKKNTNKKKTKSKNKYKGKSKKKSSSYTIKQGDTLVKIANNFNVSFIDIALLNDIENPNIISKGKVIHIPNYFYL